MASFQYKSALAPPSFAVFIALGPTVNCCCSTHYLLSHEDKTLTQSDPLSLNLSTEHIDIIGELAVRIKT